MYQFSNFLLMIKILFYNYEKTFNDNYCQLQFKVKLDI